MFGWLKRLFGYAQELVCAFCGTRLSERLAKRYGWLKMAFGWVCPDCQLKEK